MARKPIVTASPLDDLDHTLERVALADLRPHSRNYQTHPEAEIAHLMQSLTTHGVYRNVVCARDGTLLAGHGVVEAARRLGYTHLSIKRMAYGPDDPRALQLLVGDNEIAREVVKQDDALVALLQELSQDDPTALLGTGFDEATLAALADAQGLGNGVGTEDAGRDVEPQIDRAEELREHWGVELGSLWACGQHRLICGDCTDKAVVERLMQGKHATLVLTDPPYGQNQLGIPGDTPQDHERLLQACIAQLPLPEGIVIAFASPRTFPTWLDAIRCAGWHFERMLWLYKAAQETFPWRGWLLTSEAILIASRGVGCWEDVHPYSHDCYYKSEVSGELQDTLGWHGSVKPLDVVTDLMQRTCGVGTFVYDPFLGSGTTLIACENLERICYGCEIDPGYVAVTLQRYFDLTGEKAQLIG